jgi:hypothetical protein
MYRAARSRFDSDHVHAVDDLGRYPITPCPEMNVRLRFRNRQRGPHAVEIVLANEQHRQRPQRRKIETFVELAFGNGAIAEKNRP